jgi:cytochrome o ubiquinol oxidase subunit 3
MNIAVAAEIRHVAQAAPSSAAQGGHTPKEITVGYGFWIFLLSDIVMFAALFAAYAVLVHATAGGPAEASFSARSRRHRNRLSSRLELYVWADVARGWLAAPRRLHLAAVVTFALGAAF